MTRLKMIQCSLVLRHSWTYKGCAHWKCDLCGAWEIRA